MKDFVSISSLVLLSALCFFGVYLHLPQPDWLEVITIISMSSQGMMWLTFAALIVIVDHYNGEIQIDSRVENSITLLFLISIVSSAIFSVLDLSIGSAIMLMSGDWIQFILYFLTLTFIMYIISYVGIKFQPYISQL